MIVNTNLGFPGGAADKEPACQCRRCRRRRFGVLGQKDSLEEGMAAHSSILAWRIPWTEEAGGLRSTGLQKVDRTEVIQHVHTQIPIWMNFWMFFMLLFHNSVQFSSVAQSYLTLCYPMNCSMPGPPVHHQVPESTQTHVHCVGDAIQPSHPLSSPSPSALNLSQHQGLFKRVSSSHQVAKVLEFQLQHQSFQ